MPVEVIEVIDGDNFKGKVELWPNQHVETNFRINGIDTPESNYLAKCEDEWEAGIRAWSFSPYALHNAGTVSVDNVSFGKFGGRVLADVAIDGVNMANLLIESGNAREYHGKKKSDWCK